MKGQLGSGVLAGANRPANVMNEDATGYLDLLPEVANDPANLTRPYFLKARRNGVDLQAQLTDPRVAKIKGEIYFTALLPADSPLLGAARGRSGGGQVAGVFSRGGFKQTGGTTLAEPSFSGELSVSGEQAVYRSGGDSDPLEGSTAVVCMAVTTTTLSAKGQVLVQPIAIGDGVSGVVQCPPVQTARTAQLYSPLASGPLEARTLVARIDPLDEDRGQERQIFSWAVAPNGQEFMQTGPNQWQEMREPMLPAMTLTVPASGVIELPVTDALNLSALAGTLVFVGLGSSWQQVRDNNQAGHYYTVE